MPVTIYHNPRCSKSRATLALLEEHGITPEIVEYLKTPLEPARLKAILTELGINSAALLRKGEDEYKQARAAVDAMSEAERIAWMVANPKVIERPVVVTPKGARIGRPPENVLDIL